MENLFPLMFSQENTRFRRVEGEIYIRTIYGKNCKSFKTCQGIFSMQTERTLYKPCIESQRQNLFCKPYHTLQTRMEAPRFFLGSLDGFLSNRLVFSSPACKFFNKLFIYQFS